MTVAGWRRRDSSIASGVPERERILTRDGSMLLYLASCTSVASRGRPRTLHPPPVEHQLLDPTRGLGRLGLATLLRCIVGLLALEA